MNTHHRRNGFTLIELIVTVVIIAILARVAYPTYQDQVNRSRRAEGKAALLKAAQLQERNYVNGDPNVANSPPTYVTSGVLAQLFGLANGDPICSGETLKCADATITNFVPGWYVITVDAPVAGCALTDCFVVRATPNPARNFTDTQCGQLTLDNVGRRNETGTLTVADCWDR